MKQLINCQRPESNAVIESHLKEGWELANNIECGEKRKLTFRKIEKV